MIALIPARAGSKRVPGKNTRLLNGHPLLAYTVGAAQQSDVFQRIVVSSDDARTLEIAEQYGAEALECPLTIAHGDADPDIKWVRHALAAYPGYSAFAILRPTSPFRAVWTIRRAFMTFQENNDCADSIRAVQPVSEHPYKMWVSPPHCPKGYEAAYPIVPLHVGSHPDGTPWHSSPTQSLPTVYVQTSALEMAWTRCVEVYGTISGRKVAPFFGSSVEFFSIDTEADWAEAERLARESPDLLPPVGVAGVPSTPAA